MTEQLKTMYPKAWEHIKEALYQDLMESLENPEIPITEEFKTALLNIGVTDDRIELGIKVNPGSLFSSFDKEDIYISVSFIDYVKDNTQKVFRASIFNKTEKIISVDSYSRKESEKDGIYQAFGILEQKLINLENE